VLCRFLAVAVCVIDFPGGFFKRYMSLAVCLMSFRLVRVALMCVSDILASCDLHYFAFVCPVL
jgi:hypothetical protein